MYGLNRLVCLADLDVGYPAPMQVLDVLGVLLVGSRDTVPCLVRYLGKGTDTSAANA